MIEKYEQYLDKINVYLQKYFEQQKPYIFCKEGCSICCELGEYPFSKLEFEYAMLGYNSLSAKDKNIVSEEIIKLKKEKGTSKDKKFLYKCPFLIDKKCSIYSYRGLLCRSYGLVYFTADENDKLSYNMPCCIDNGLNYSNVYDAQTHSISSGKWKATGIAVEPVSYNVGLNFLLNNDMTQELSIELGKAKALIDWF